MKKMPTVLVMSFVIFVKLVQGQMVNPDIQLSHNNEELLNSNNFNDDEGDEGEDSDEDNVISFSSSAFPHYTQRKYTYDDLRQLYRSVGCVSDEIHVDCRHDANSMVVIENATFYAVPDDSWLNCSQGPLGPLAMGGLVESAGVSDSGLQSSIFAGVSGFSSLTNVRDLRQALNRWCSGMAQKKPCTFNLQLDHEESVSWGMGIVDVYYRCVPDYIIHRKCNSEVRVKEEIGFSSSSQFLMSPVYPKYYVGGRRCKWTLRSDPGQRIQLRFLDISLREEVSQSSHPQCADSIRVTERGRNLLSMCGESKQDIVLLSDANKLEVRLETNSHGIFSTRGILAEFWPLGCATPTDPGNGYLHIRNHTHANYACHGGYVFQDTLERTKTLICDDQRGHWYDTMAVNCVSLQYLRRYGNSTIQTLLAAKEGPSQGGSSQRITIVPPLSAAWFSDIVIPAVIVSIVVVVSLFAVVVLLLLRRHIQLEGREGSYQREHDDRNALTPASVRRHSPPPPPPLHHPQQQQPTMPQQQQPQQPQRTPPDLQNNHHNGGIVMHVDLDRHHLRRQQREELFLC